MNTKIETFRSFHASPELFLLPNAWDARSAIMFQESGFQAIATSSAAVANSMGFEDGENMNFVDYLFVIRRILASIDIPLTVDIETGYGTTDEEISDNVLRLAKLGVVGINIEDSVIHNNTRSLKDPITFATTIGRIKDRLKWEGLDLFINLRCDTYILNVDNKQKETLDRLKVYNASAADGIFVPCINNASDIAEVAANTKLPLNVMCVPGLPDLDELSTLGVRRVSMGPFIFQKIYSGIGKVAKDVFATRTFSPVL